MQQRSGSRIALGAVGLALFGIFAMHGWGMHGSGHDSMRPDVVHGTCATHSTHCSPDDAAGSGHGAGLTGLCLAVLFAAVAVAFALPRHWTIALPEVGFRLHRPLMPTWIRERDPPDLLALGVIRC